MACSPGSVQLDLLPGNSWPRCLCGYGWLVVCPMIMVMRDEDLLVERGNGCSMPACFRSGTRQLMQ